jgi:hypothetical protein
VDDARAASDARDEALDLLQTANDRVRVYYCDVSDDEDKTPELAKIGKQPRRDRGEVQQQPCPKRPASPTSSGSSATPEGPASVFEALASSIGGSGCACAGGGR